MNDVLDSAAPRQDSFTRDFGVWLASRKGAEPAWLTKAREDAFSSFSERGFPTRNVESWKYALVRPIANGEFRRAPASTVTDTVIAESVADSATVARVVLVDGVVDAARTSFSALPAGLRIESIAQILTREPDRLRATLSATAPHDHVFAALNTAFASDGVVVTVAPGAVIESPIEILSFTSGGATAQHSRIVVSLGQNSQASVIELHRSLGAGASLANVMVDVELHDGAVLEHVKVSEEDLSAFHVAATRVRQIGRDSTYKSRAISLGGAFHRHSLYVDLLAPGANCDLLGLYVLRGTQNHDHYTVIDHAVPNTTSVEHYKGVFDEKSRGTFFGRILVKKDAQKTSSTQKNDNLLLSNEALANSTPQLEILADDVKCAHGSTIGQLDGEGLYYLRSRGIGKDDARELLTYAFANEILDRLPFVALRERLSRHLTREPQRETLATD